MSFYGAVSDADTYHADRGHSDWTGTDAVKEQALLRASEYVDYQFRPSFPGYKAGLRAQTREWPRDWAYDEENNSIPSDEVPIEVERATYEAALRELTTPDSLLPDYTPNQHAKREKVDVLEVEYAGPTGPESEKPILTIVRGILQPILTGPAVSGNIGRSVRS